MAPRALYFTTNTVLPLNSISFRVKRELFQNSDKIGFYHIEGDYQGVSYQLIWNSHQEQSSFTKREFIHQLKEYKQNSRISVTGNWNILTRVIGSSVTNTVSVDIKTVEESRDSEFYDGLGVPSSSVFVKHTNDAELLLRALETQNEALKAKLRVEDSVHADIIEKLIPSKRAAVEAPTVDPKRSNNGSQGSVSQGQSTFPVLGSVDVDINAKGQHIGQLNAEQTNTFSVHDQASASGTGEEPSQTQNGDPPVEFAKSTNFDANQQGELSKEMLKLGTLAEPISLDSEDEDMDGGEAVVPVQQ
ncbi:hypothetical protein BGZ47_000788 [Haplosporangium gracile]|nr:hypothetical protein BGZ47_000788 [Haplosporangium gracile]